MIALHDGPTGKITSWLLAPYRTVSPLSAYQCVGTPVLRQAELNKVLTGS